MSIPAINNAIISGLYGTGKVSSGVQNSLKSREILFPENMMCPIWTGMDNSGRPACEYSFYTKSAGCNSAIDRIVIENEVGRPLYAEYLLDANGINGPNYDRKKTQNITGQFGTVSPAESINPTSGRISLDNVLQDPASRTSQYNRNLQSAYRGANNSNLQAMQRYPQTIASPTRYSVNPKGNYEIPSYSNNSYVTMRQYS